MHFRILLQFDEAFGPDNRWFCSEFYGKEIDNKELLLSYYIQSGGAADFAKRYDQAMGAKNRWYCSEFYRREIRDPEILWDYFIKHTPVRAIRKNQRYELDESRAEMSVAC